MAHPDITHSIPTAFTHFIPASFTHFITASTNRIPAFPNHLIPHHLIPHLTDHIPGLSPSLTVSSSTTRCASPLCRPHLSFLHLSHLAFLTFPLIPPSPHLSSFLGQLTINLLSSSHSFFFLPLSHFFLHLPPHLCSIHFITIHFPLCVFLSIVFLFCICERK